ncbi:MAG: hypothetical protein ABH851_08955 [Methanobacteriota archaeon]
MVGLWNSKKVALFLILVVGVVIVSGCIKNGPNTTSTIQSTTIKPDVTTQSFWEMKECWCNGCVFISSKLLPYKLKYFINFDVLSKRASSLGYFVNLSGSTPLGGGENITLKRSIDIRKKEGNYTYHIVISENFYPNRTTDQNVDRVYFGKICNYSFAREKMNNALDELGIVIKRYFEPDIYGIPENPNSAVGCYEICYF